MSHLVPCPECSRHVRVSETECPFCALPLDLASTPEPQLPKTRLGRAATFAFGATLISATALAACSSDGDDSTGAGGATSAAGTGAGGATSTAGTGAGGSTAIAGTSGSLGGTGGSAMAVYGAPAAGSFGNGSAGTGNGAGGGPFPVYGAAP